MTSSLRSLVATLIALAGLLTPALARAVTATWVRLPADATTPTVWRDNSAAVWDAARDRALGYGGEQTYHIPAAGDHTLTSECLTAFTLPLGISVTASCLNDMIGSPGGPVGAAMALDPVADRLWVFGGLAPRDDPYSGLPPVWSVTLTTADLGAAAPAWSWIPVSGPRPVPRLDPALAIDLVRRRLLLYGGRDSNGAELDDLWAFPLDGGDAWQRLSPAGPAPSARADGMLWIDPLEDRAVLAGGTRAGAPLSDAWALSLDGAPAWAPLAGAGRAPTTPVLAWTRDAARDRAIAFTAGVAESVWVLDRTAADEFTWRPATSIGGPPAPQPARTPAVYDETDQRATLLFAEYVPDFSRGYELGLATHWAVMVHDDPVVDVAPAGAGGSALALGPAVPNPAGASFRIAFAVPERCPATLELLGVDGRRVRVLAVDGAGRRQVAVSTAGLRPGLYLARLATPMGTRVRRVAILR